MKQKTRNRIAGLKRDIATVEQVFPDLGDVPAAGSLQKYLFDAGNRWGMAVVKQFPRYQIPETASLFARALHWEIQEEAYILPGGSLLVCWDTELPGCLEILTEAEYLHTIAERSVDAKYYNDEQRDDLIKFCRAHLRRNP